MPPMSLLIKPSSSLCQMRCKYCFYHSLAQNREVASYGIMEEATLEKLIREALEYADGSCAFAFQGGEPTMAGLDFFRKAVLFQKQYNKKHVRITNAIQTNGYCIDEEWAAFFHENEFLVGLSMDGYPAMHDKYRPDASGKGTYKKVEKTAALFDQYKVEYNILQVITAEAARQPEKIYKYYKQKNFRYLQFIPCLDPYDAEWGSQPYSLKPEGWEYFHKGLFDCWYRDFMAGNYISIRYFDNLVHMLMGHGAEACPLRGRCSNQWVVEGDGSLYPCDFYVVDRWRIGNIYENGFAEMAESGVVKDFIAQSLEKDANCAGCKWYGLCRGGCRRERNQFDEAAGSANHYCEAYRHFFEYAYERLLQAARYVQQMQRRS